MLSDLVQQSFSHSTFISSFFFTIWHTLYLVCASVHCLSPLHYVPSMSLMPCLAHSWYSVDSGWKRKRKWEEVVGRREEKGQERKREPTGSLKDWLTPVACQGAPPGLPKSPPPWEASVSPRWSPILPLVLCEDSLVQNLSMPCFLAPVSFKPLDYFSFVFLNM